ncbi:uncharacterized protein LOC106640537 [Copidosoma floridanum]|uniref:uncharacterized protein LOC106640537 n=1 Tax=Copidosoma floridanum TaxID=29053 RepID=UPI000C6F70A9|nr:uncharacterized protein LOC106640537 [Copidosoma floridanum]
MEKSEECFECACSYDGEEQVEAQIEITIDSIENIIRNERLLLEFVVEHDNAVLGTSKLIRVDASYENIEATHPIDFTSEVVFSTNDLRSIEPIVSSPVLIKVFEILESHDQTVESIKGKESNEEIPKRRSRSEKSTLGLCNVDLLPIILGERYCTEKLVLETPSLSWDGEIVSWANLPRISVTIKREDCDVELQDAPFNLLTITVESIYNPPSYFNDHLDYKCGTVWRTDKDIKDSSIVFGRGKWTELRDVEQTKSWRALEGLNSRARLSKYKISCDCEGVKNSFKRRFDLKTTIDRNEKRIEWNSMHRILLDDECAGHIVDRLNRRKCWPFEIMVSEKDSEDPKHESDDDGFGAVVYQCYVDAGQLLFPGTTKTRILSQLFTQSLPKMKEKTGLSSSIFIDRANQDDHDRGSNDSCAADTVQDDVEDLPLFTESGAPVLILIEFELHRPFFASRDLEDYIEALEDLRRKPRPKHLLYAYTPDLVRDQYVDCVKQLVDILGEDYRDDLSRFKQYLHESGKYATIRDKLKSKITNLLDQKLALKPSGWYSMENQNFITSCYTYLVEQMHTALNDKLEVRQSLTPCTDESSDELWLRAEEAHEFGDHKKADMLFTKLVYEDRKNPDAWVRYAAYFARKSEFDEATECCREAIELNARHKIGLMFYGILLALKEDYNNAEVFLKSILYMYPRFAEGWAVLHLFYVKIQYYPGIDLTLSTAEKCLHDRTRDTEDTSFLDQEALAWSTMLCRKNRIFHLTAVLLLKLNLYEFAEMALAQELCHGERDVEFLYFTSVCHYLRGDHAGAITLLSEAEMTIGLEYSVAALLGHSRYKLHITYEAVMNYESVDMMYDRPEAIHLVHMKLGFHYIDSEEYERARNVFLRASACPHRTCKTWLGLGIASYHLKIYEESEVALMEANRIDDEDAEVWAYLCLLSMAQHRRDEFAQCYRQMVKNDLKSDKIWRLIKHSMDAFDYSSPIAVLGSLDHDKTVG